jgi:catechol 2,3-dioxygenase-like lactoylglutathione lyase family enzyme
LLRKQKIFVTDLAASLAFYHTSLGFEEVFRYGEPPFYAQTGRDGVRLNLRTEPWGARTFIVKDPDGNLIAFAGKGAEG